MARKTSTTRRKNWAYSAGSRGVNRVRAVRHPKNDGLYLEWSAVDGEGVSRVQRRALVGASQDEAKAEADRLAVALLIAPTAAVQGPITLGRLFDTYLKEVSPRTASFKYHERASALFLAFFGRERGAHTLSVRDVDAYVQERRSGRLAPSGRTGKPVRDRVLEQDITFLNTVLNWAVRAGDGEGQYLLRENPVRGAKIPREKNVRRPRLQAGEYEKMLAVAGKVSPLFELALVLCYETGHRLNSVRQLRWQDVDLRTEHHETVRWIGERQKTKVEHVTPLTPEAVAALKRVRVRTATIGEGWIFPAARSNKPADRGLFYKWWEKAQQLAELPPHPGRFHKFRRHLASRLVPAPLSVVQALGGWESPHVVVRVYQHASIEQQREAMSQYLGQAKVG